MDRMDGEFQTIAGEWRACELIYPYEADPLYNALLLIPFPGYAFYPEPQQIRVGLKVYMFNPEKPLEEGWLGNVLLPH